MLDQLTPLAANPGPQPLTQVIRQRVVPALIDLHGAAGPLPEALELARDVLRGGQGETLVQRLIVAGLPFEGVMLRLIGPAACHLGAMWETDECSFAEVTLGLWRLRGLSARVADLMPGLAVAPDPARSILLTTLPGEQHDFGVSIAAEFLARDGWMVTRGVSRDTAELLAELRALRPALIGISVSRAATEPALAALIGQIRRIHPSPRILIGGPAVALDPMIARRCGADAAAICARSALDAAQSLFAAPALAPSFQPQRKDRCVGNPESGGGVPGPGPGRHGAARLGRG